jgi:hypothetical protein
MEPPSQASKNFNIEAEEEKSKLNEEEKEILEMIRCALIDWISLRICHRDLTFHESIICSKSEAQKTPEPPKERVKRKATAPNPLSMQRAAEVFYVITIFNFLLIAKKSVLFLGFLSDQKKEIECDTESAQINDCVEYLHHVI